MTRRLTDSEKTALPDLAIVVPGYYGSHPFSRANPEVYLEEELKKKAKRKSARTNWFEQRLFAIWRELGGEVPYAFRVGGEVRSLDAGCLGYLVNCTTPELALSKDSGGYIVGVIPIGRFATRYTDIEDRLRAEVRPLVNDSAMAEEEHCLNGTLINSDETDLADDVAELVKDESLSETERKQLINARIGQGAFRAKVLRKWNNCCAVTGCELRPVLRASHIKPWRDSSNAERLDPDNGLPLAANIDALFECGLISFANDGSVLFSSRLEDQHYELVLPPRRLSKSLTAKARGYLSLHRRANGFG